VLSSKKKGTLGSFCSPRAVSQSISLGRNPLEKDTSLLDQQNMSSNHLSKIAEINQNKQIIFFEGCNPILGCTILLSG
jgi:hypothetical protein